MPTFQAEQGRGPTKKGKAVDGFAADESTRYAGWPASRHDGETERK
jgi:hypothetical protein